MYTSGTTSSTLNLIIYGVFNQTFFREYKRILRFKLEKVKDYVKKWRFWVGVKGQVVLSLRTDRVI